MKNVEKQSNKIFILTTIILSFASGFLGGLLSNYYSNFSNQEINSSIINKTQDEEYLPQEAHESKVISVVKESFPAVVSIIITKDLPILEEYWVSPFDDDFWGPRFQVPQYREKGTEKKEVGGGTGFIISSDGMIITNRHVVSDEDAEYTVLTNDGEKYEASIIARDPVLDFAVLKITDNSKNFSTIKLGDSLNLQIGQTVIAIGNALAEFKNTVSVGVVSGLGRTVSASDGNTAQVLEDIIQTDAAINQGNSGGPLLNLKGEVIGINTAMAMGAENIGFAIPVDKIKRGIEQVKENGKIVYPFLGVSYLLVTEEIQEENDLSVNYGAWITSSDGKAILPDSAAEKAGLKENDIILELNNEKITSENSLAKVIMKYYPGDSVSLKILRNKEEIMVSVVLGERTE